MHNAINYLSSTAVRIPSLDFDPATSKSVIIILCDDPPILKFFKRYFSIPILTNLLESFVRIDIVKFQPKVPEQFSKVIDIDLSVIVSIVRIKSSPQVWFIRQRRFHSV